MTLEVTQMSSLLHNKQIMAQVNGDAEVIVNRQMVTCVRVQLTTMPTVSSFCKQQQQYVKDTKFHHIWMQMIQILCN